MSYYAMYRQVGVRLSLKEKSKTKIVPEKNLKNFVILKAKNMNLFDFIMPLSKQELAELDIIIITNAVDSRFWR